MIWMLKSTHEREMAKVISERDDARASAERQLQIAKSNLRIASRANDRVAELTAKLAPFVAPKNRGPGGRFLPGVGK